MQGPLANFPPDFVWGAATAAYQVEGSVEADGRTPSIWDTFSHQPGNVDNGDTGDIACDSYRRWPEDVQLLRTLGISSYRFSVAWPRVVPALTGETNAAGLAHYDRMVDGLLETGIRPMVTLYHWDLPQYLQDRGGWTERDTAYRLADFAGVVVRALGDRVRDWCTVNEPLCVAWIGHHDGTMAPGLHDITAAVRASYHVLLGHGLVCEAVRSEASLSPSLGLVANLSPCRPASEDPADMAAARRADGFTNRWWLDPVFGRGFPADMVDLYGVNLPVHAGDLATIAAPLDFLGVNYYFTQPVAADPQDSLLGTRSVPTPDATTTAMGWEVDPTGLEEILVRVTEDYQPPAIYVTENGSAYVDTVDDAGDVGDPERIAYLESHVAACAQAVERGVPLKGYYAWSLLDNFEWAYGYDKRFGLVRVDFETQQRTVKASGWRYASLISEHHAVTRLRPAVRDSA